MGVAGAGIRRVRRFSEGVLETIYQQKVLRGAGAENAPEVFILGLPRSGTTLVYQYIVHRLQAAYFTSDVGRHPYSPVLATERQKKRNPPYVSDFTSIYGRARGAMAPREAGSFWLRFFDVDDYQSFGDISAADAETMRRTVRAIQALFNGAFFVNKNVKHVMRIDALAKIFPSSRFLVVRRDLRDVALSCLRARVITLGNVERWFSVKPRSYEMLKALDPAEQVARQVVDLEADLEKDLAELESGRVGFLDYEEFCSRPDTVIETLAVLSDAGESNPKVDQFDRKVNRTSVELEERMLAHLDALLSR